MVTVLVQGRMGSAWSLALLLITRRPPAPALGGSWPCWSPLLLLGNRHGRHEAGASQHRPPLRLRLPTHPCPFASRRFCCLPEPQTSFWSPGLTFHLPPWSTLPASRSLELLLRANVFPWGSGAWWMLLVIQSMAVGTVMGCWVS
ncbi:hypothetical protein MLD38_025580 [Melastoma candidum]|uniref:Uncharacterized protein n=1 Tax=Melastoma candidum TaxID=119954 RepID=A0ACB9NX69_9MYRT|nr:hypothetical protein MLD38_025580 [Melastoma candidum]